MLTEVRRVVLEPRAFFAQLPDGASRTFPISIALVRVQVWFWSLYIAGEFRGRPVDLFQIANSFLPALQVAVGFSLVAPVLLVAAWAPVRLAAGPGRRG